MEKTLVIIGGGAAGFFTAINAKLKRPDLKVTVLEATARLLTKVKISGGGRCNVTHNEFDPKKLVNNYPRGAKELLGAFYQFNPSHTIDWFKQRGVELKVEKDGRMFPITDSSTTIINTFLDEARRLGIEIRKRAFVDKVEHLDDEFMISLKGGEQLKSDYLLLATGSSPVGHSIAKSLGHSITDLSPSLFTFEIESELLEGNSGVSFQDAEIFLKIEGKKKKWSFSGPTLITHWGLSGPAVLKLSAFAARELYNSNYKAIITVRWDKTLTEEAAAEVINKFKSQNLKKNIIKNPALDFPKRFWAKACEVAAIKENKIYADLSKKELNKLLSLLVNCQLEVSGKGVFKEEFVTCGGIAMKEVDTKKFESKLHSGLFFAGEILDVDGITGGFNFQNAWTSSYLVSEAISQK